MSDDRKCRWCPYDASDDPSTKRARYYLKVHEEIVHPNEKYDADVSHAKA